MSVHATNPSLVAALDQDIMDSIPISTILASSAQKELVREFKSIP